MQKDTLKISRKGGNSMKGYSKKIEDMILTLPSNKLIIASELYNNHLKDIPELTYYKALERLSQKGIIMHLTTGVYYRSEVPEVDVQSVREDIVNYYTENGCGVVIGKKLYHRIGITKEEGEKTEVLSNRLKEEKKNICNVEIKKLNFGLNKETAQMIKILDIMQNCEKINSLNKKNLMRYLAYYCQLYSDEVANYVIRNKKYKKSTIAFLADTLDKFEVKHSLSQYLSPLSKYKIPILKKEGKDMPNSVANIVAKFSEHVEKLFGNKLSKIILYGSYARGDYHDNSDVDIMILVKMSDDEEIRKCENELYDMVYDIEMETGADISPIVQKEDHFEYWVDTLPFYRNVRDEGIVLNG